MKEKKDKLLRLISEKFFKEGFYKITMDEIASYMHISKKTIYKYFPSKEELLEILIKNFLENRSKKIEAIINSEHNAVYKIVVLINTIKKIVIQFSNRWIMDIQYHFPILWQSIEDFRTKMITRNFSTIFNQGIKEGYILDIPPQIVLTVFINTIRVIINPDFILQNNLPANEAAEHTLKILFNGIFTDKGRNIFQEIINQKGWIEE